MMVPASKPPVTPPPRGSAADYEMRRLAALIIIGLDPSPTPEMLHAAAILRGEVDQ